jgi:transglutaminase-like putative cysteine protease
VVRVATLLAVLVAVAAVAIQEEFTSQAILAAGGIVVGYVVSYLRRRGSNWWLKIALTAGILFAMREFFAALVANPYDPRIPLVQLFLWLQVLHSFDLPARKDLKYSLASAVILLAIGAVYTRATTFGWFLVVFVLAAATAWIALQGRQARLPLRTLVRLGAQLSVGVLLCAMAVFALTPRSEGLRLRWMPVSPHLPWMGRLHARIVNPAYPDVAGRDPEQEPGVFNPQGYVGFSTFVDLRLRGVLTDTLVMRVRTTRRAFWRGLAFDAYTGRGWKMTDRTVNEYTSDQPRIVPQLGPDEPWPAGSEQVVQTFYIEAEQPNVIFAAYRPFELYFPTGTIGVDRYAGLRSPVILETGVVYSVISRVPEPTNTLLKRARGEVPSSVAERYMALPPIPDRVQRLADDLTAGVESPYQKARAIYHYFQNGFTYTLQAPELPEGADAVDTFLFVTRQGSCEIFASAMAVLLRAAGIPTRLVTGYATGTYNILTGYYEVRNSDAHAWVEIFHPGIGWLEIEATPSFESVVDFSQQPTGQWLARDAAEWVVAAIARSAHALLGSAVGGGSVAAIALVAGGLAAGWAARFRRRRSTRGPRDRIERDYQMMLRGLARRGFVRHPAATPREFAGALPIPLRSSAGQVTHLFEAFRYGHEPSNPRIEQISHAALHELREELRRSRGGERRPRQLKRAP